MVASRVALGVNNYTSDTTTFLIDHPTGGWVEGDILVFSVTTASSTPRTFTLRQGTTTLSKVDLFGPVTNSSSYGLAAYHIITSGGAFQFNVLLDGASQGTVAWQVLRGVDLNNPVNASVISTSSGSTPHTLPSMTTTKGDCLITGGIFQGSGSAAWTAPSPWVIDVDGTRRNGILTHKGLQSTAGATGSSSWVMPGGDNANAQIYQIAWNSAEPPTPPIEATLMSEPFPSASGDVADGAAIIPDPSTPGNSVVLVTSKDDSGSSGGVYVLDMDGEIVNSYTGFAPNSVDWRDTTGLSGWDGRILVFTCDRYAGSYDLRFYWFDRSTRALTLASTVNIAYQPYGTCLGIVGGALYAYVSDRGPDDTSPRNMYQYLLTRSGNSVSIGSPVRTVSVASVVEGMVVDDIGGGWFCSQEDVGLFRYGAAPGSGSTRTTVDTVGANLVADVEDVAIADTADGKKLLVSSQGDNSYHVYDLTTLAHEQRFMVARPAGGGGVTGTDGLDVRIANLGSTFPHGLIVVHDDGLDPSRFAFVDAALVFGELPEPIPEGSGSLAYAFTLTGASVTPPKAAGSLGHAWALTGAGETEHGSAGTLSHVWALAGAGEAAPKGSGGVAHVWSLTGQGATLHAATGSLGYAFEVAGASSSVPSGAGALGYGFDINGAGETTPKAAGTLDHSFTLDGAGATTREGAGTLGYGFDLAGAGSAAGGGFGSIAYAFSLAGAAAAVPKGYGVLSHGWALDGSGAAPDVTVPTGTGHLEYALALVGAGAVARRGAGTIAHAWQVVGGSHVGPLPPFPARPRLYAVTRRSLDAAARRTLEGVS